MTLRDTLARVTRRNPETPSLRERAAALRASVARLKRAKPVPDAAKSSDLRYGRICPADPSDPVFAAIEAHTLAYGEYISHPEFGEGTPGDYARSDAEDAAFEALLHTPLTTADGKIAYALAVIERETGSKATRSDPPIERDDPLPIAYRNLRFGEHEAEKAAQAAPVAVCHDDKASQDEASPALLALVRAYAEGQRRLIELDEEGHESLTDEERSLARQGLGLLHQIHAFRSANLADLCAKLPAFRLELDAASPMVDAESDDLPARAWRGLIADLERLSKSDTPATMEALAPLDFQAIALDEPSLTPRLWAQRFQDCTTMGLCLADRYIRLDKAGAVAFFRGAQAKDDELAEITAKAFDGALETLRGWVNFLELGQSRFFVAASAVAAMPDEEA